MLNNTNKELKTIQLVLDVKCHLQENAMINGGFGGGEGCCVAANDPAFDMEGSRFEAKTDMFGNIFLTPVIDYGNIRAV
jgi:hypothetical protein